MFQSAIKMIVYEAKCDIYFIIYLDLVLSLILFVKIDIINFGFCITTLKIPTVYCNFIITMFRIFEYFLQNKMIQKSLRISKEFKNFRNF